MNTSMYIGATVIIGWTAYRAIDEFDGGFLLKSCDGSATFQFSFGYGRAMPQEDQQALIEKYFTKYFQTVTKVACAA